MGLPLRKIHPLRYYDHLSLLSWIEYSTLSLLLKLPQRKLSLNLFFEFFFELRFCIALINLQPVHTQNTLVMSRLVLLIATWCSQLLKFVGRAVVPVLAASLQFSCNRRNVNGLNLYDRYYQEMRLSELTEFVPFPCYFDRLHDLYVIIPRSHNEIYVSSFFPRTTRPWDSCLEDCL